MAKVCDICSKGVMSGNNVSHSNRKSRTCWAPNVQKVKILENGQTKSVYVCTRCLRSGKVTRAL
jgi:large subunit ribosomal protein L28